MAGALVLTGVQTYQDVISVVPEQRPTYILRTLDDFFEPYPQVEILHDDHAITAHVPSWAAKVQGNNLFLTVQGSFAPEGFSGSAAEAEAWRVACAAWWVAHPEQAVTPNIQGLPEV